jgi:hypothetical protein
MIVRNTSLAKIGYSVISPYKDPNVTEDNIIPKPFPAISILSTYFHMTHYNLRKSVTADLGVLIALIPTVSHSHPPNLLTSHLREISFHAFSPPSFIPRRLSHRNFEINPVFLIPYIGLIHCVLYEP